MTAFTPIAAAFFACGLLMGAVVHARLFTAPVITMEILEARQ